MVLLLHGVLLTCVTFEGSFYTFSMSQKCEEYREVFSFSMNALAQLQSAVVVEDNAMGNRAVGCAQAIRDQPASRRRLVWK